MVQPGRPWAIVPLPLRKMAPRGAHVTRIVTMGTLGEGGALPSTPESRAAGLWTLTILRGDNSCPPSEVAVLVNCEETGIIVNSCLSSSEPGSQQIIQAGEPRLDPAGFN